MSDTVTRNGITLTRPVHMNKTYWETFVAPRVGKWYNGVQFGADVKQVTFGHEEMEDGCGGGACTI